MRFRGLDASGDWMSGQGLGSYAKDADALALNLATRIRSWVGNCFFDPEIGVDWAKRLDKNQQASLLADLQTIILQTDGVVKINSVSAVTNPETRSVDVSYNIDTIFTQSFQSNINIISGGVPNA